MTTSEHPPHLGELLRSLLATSDFVDTTNVGMVLRDSEGTVIDSNEAGLVLWADPERAFIGSDVSAQNVGVIKQDGTQFSTEEVPSLIAMRERRQIINEIIGIDRFAERRRWLNLTSHPVIVDGRVEGVITSYLDVTHEVEQRIMLELLAKTYVLVSSVNVEAEFLQGFCDILVESGGYPLAWIGVPPDDGGTDLTYPYAAGMVGYLHPGTVSISGNVPRGRGPTAVALQTGETQVANNFLSQVECEPWQERALEFKLASAMAIPFSVSTKAVLTIYSHNTQAFDDVLVDGLREIVHRVETTSALYRSLDETRHSLDGTIKALALMAEVRDPYTEGHQHRAGELASAIATYLHVDEALIHLIEMSGQVHDIGKVAVPAEMLTRPGRLSSLEFEMVKQHCLVGHQILQSASLPWPLPEVALQHHERLDGSGYPYGLTGDEIRLPARIVAVADVVEAMTNDRPYRAALGLEQALAEISAGRGTRFDAEVVDACIAVFERGYRFDPSSVFGPLQTD